MVVTADALGSGRADRPTDPAAYNLESAADDMLAVMDATGASPAALVGFSAGCHLAVVMAAMRPECTLGLVLVGNGLPLAPGHAERRQGSATFEQVLSSHQGWQRTNRQFWLSNYPDYIIVVILSLGYRVRVTADDTSERANVTDGRKLPASS